MPIPDHCRHDGSNHFPVMKILRMKTFRNKLSVKKNAQHIITNKKELSNA